MERWEVTAHHRIYAKLQIADIDVFVYIRNRKLQNLSCISGKAKNPQNNDFMIFLNYARKLEHTPCHESWLEARFGRDPSAYFKKKAAAECSSFLIRMTQRCKKKVQGNHEF